MFLQQLCFYCILDIIYYITAFSPRNKLTCRRRWRLIYACVAFTQDEQITKLCGARESGEFSFGIRLSHELSPRSGLEVAVAVVVAVTATVAVVFSL